MTDYKLQMTNKFARQNLSSVICHVKGGRASPRAGQRYKPKDESMPAVIYVCGFGNGGSRGRDPSRSLSRLR
jgi:hypothetical protein